MSKKIFISYSHKQEDWVWQRLKPCLDAGGAEVLIDRNRFKAGIGTIKQMNDTQDGADASLLVLTPDYLASDHCQHEMRRAIARDPDFANGSTIPVKLQSCQLPDEIKIPDPLWVNLTDEKNSEWWDKLMLACEADLGADVPHWLEVRDEILRYMERNQSVNLVVKGNPKWKEMIEHIRDQYLNTLGIVHLGRGTAVPRRSLVKEIIKSCGIDAPVPPEPEDLRVLDETLSSLTLSHVALLELDHAINRMHYGTDLFSSLMYLIVHSRKLVLLAQSYQPYMQIINAFPIVTPLSSINLQTVELTGANQ